MCLYFYVTYVHLIIQYSKLPDLSEYRKDIVVDLFNTRNQSLNKIYTEYLIQKEETIRKY